MPAPEPDPLTAEQIQELEADLIELRARLQTELVQAKQSAAPVDLDTPIGRVSRIDAIQQQSMASAHRQNVELRLQLIAQALRAIGDDEYGICRSCDEPIAFRRLKVRPESPFCVQCQGRRSR